MKTTPQYKSKLDLLLSPEERRVFQKLSTPKKIQDFLDSFPIHFAGRGDKIRGPKEILRLKKMHCIEGALVGALALLYHAKPPLLLDLQANDADDDHVVALFKENGRWGAISKTNYSVLRWRDPVYISVRELAMSYFHEYFLWQKHGNARGKKSMLAYSKPYDLRRFKPQDWVGGKDLDWLAESLDSSPHFPIAPSSVMKKLRPASKIEINTLNSEEWSRRGKRTRF